MRKQKLSIPIILAVSRLLGFPFLVLVIGMIFLQIFFIPCASAFQSFEEFTRSKNKLSNLKVKAISEPFQARSGEWFHLHLMVEIAPGWHIYSLEEQAEDEPLATRIYFENNGFHSGQVWKEPEPDIIMDGALNKVVKVHKNTVQFSQKQFVPGSLIPGDYLISGRIVYRACDNRICSLPREADFQTHVQILAKETSK